MNDKGQFEELDRRITMAGGHGLFFLDEIYNNTLNALAGFYKGHIVILATYLDKVTLALNNVASSGNRNDDWFTSHGAELAHHDSRNPYDAKMNSDSFYSALLDGTANNFIIVATMGKVHKRVLENDRSNRTAFAVAIDDMSRIVINGTVIKNVNITYYWESIVKLFAAENNGKFVQLEAIKGGRTYAKFLNDLGFSGKLRKLFFPATNQEKGILVHRRVTYGMLEVAGFTEAEIEDEVKILASKVSPRK